jgi:hypothetical protein
MTKKPRKVINLSSSLNFLNGITITPKNIFKSLDYIRDASLGVRATDYQLMALAWQGVLLLRKDKELLEKFKRKAGLTAKKGNIADAVMVYGLRAETKSMKQMAWKRSRVLQFLHEQGVKLGKMASEIETRGGIEAVYNQAVKLMPRRVSKSAKKKGSKTVSSVQKAKKNGLSKPSVETASDSENRSPRTNDQALTIELGIKLSDRDELFELSKDAKAKLTIERTNNLHGVQFKVIRFKELTSEPKSESW